MADEILDEEAQAKLERAPQFFAYFLYGETTHPEIYAHFRNANTALDHMTGRHMGFYHLAAERKPKSMFMGARPLIDPAQIDPMTRWQDQFPQFTEETKTPEQSFYMVCHQFLDDEFQDLPLFLLFNRFSDERLLRIKPKEPTPASAQKCMLEISAAAKASWEGYLKDDPDHDYSNARDEAFKDFTAALDRARFFASFREVFSKGLPGMLSRGLTGGI
ncbi:hypothetical protein ACMA5I_11550 [Paracoccaceae bacterium GXU_MW_L88]